MHDAVQHITLCSASNKNIIIVIIIILSLAYDAVNVVKGHLTPKYNIAVDTP